MKSYTVHILNGPNLNLVGLREPEVYGSVSFEEFIPELKLTYPAYDIQYFQSNHEGALIDKIHEIGFLDRHVGIINPGGLSHTSISLRDAIAAVQIPFIEVHMSDIKNRESFRQHSYMEDVCVTSIVGKGLDSYTEAIEFFKANSFKT